MIQLNKNTNFIFTSESVSSGHPDKIADQISDAILDNILAFDPNSRVACETLVTTGQVILAGEITTNTYVDLQEIARSTIKKIGYINPQYMFDGDSCGILNSIHEQSPDISMGVSKNDPNEQGAGDQGMMFGYACDETRDYMPLPVYLSHEILKTLEDVRKNTTLMPYLRPDAKCQVSVVYEEHSCENISKSYGNKHYREPKSIHTILVSTQHDDLWSTQSDMQNTISRDITDIIIPRTLERINDVFITDIFKESNYRLLVNPTGKFVIGGPHGDTGLTGRKIIVDTYGGFGAHGGGAFSGKDPSKVDRSGAYMARYIAKNMVASGVADEMLVQISYAIGISNPISVFVNTFGTCNIDKNDSEISQAIQELFNLRPHSIEEKLRLRKPIYSETSTYGHFGRTPRVVKKVFESKYSGKVEMDVELFTWEKLDSVEKIMDYFKMEHGSIVSGSGYATINCNY